MAWIGQGLFGELIELFRFDSVMAQAAAQAEVSQEAGDEGDGPLVGFAVRTFHNVQSTGNANAPIQSRFAGGAKIHAADQIQSVGQAMMHAANGREWMRQ